MANSVFAGVVNGSNENGWELVAQSDVAGAVNVVFTDLDGYDNYAWVAAGINHIGPPIRMSISDDNGSTWKASNVYYRLVGQTNYTIVGAQSNSTDQLRLTYSPGSYVSGYRAFLWGYIFDPQNTSDYNHFLSAALSQTGSAGYHTHAGGAWTGGTGAINAIRFQNYNNAWNFTDGQIYIYGINNG